jgi:hypothetical protein
LKPSTQVASRLLFLAPSGETSAADRKLETAPPLL